MKRICLLIIITFSFASLFAQSLLYKVTGKCIENPIYIFGTIHAIPQSDFFMDDIVMEKFEMAQKIVFEIDMSNPNMILEVQSAMMMNNNSIDKLTTQEDYSKLKKFFADSLLLPLDHLKQVKPLMMSSFLIPKIIGEALASYETYFLQKAMEMGKPIGGLETVTEQIGYIDKIPLEKQVSILLESIDDFNESKNEYRNLVAVYKTKNVESIYYHMMESIEEYKEFGEFLIYERNRNWISKILALGNKQVTFIAVGCGHLGGENGILNLLRNEGLTVEMVNN
jgi:uncharacterized protein